MVTFLGSDIFRLHLEITSACALSCCACQRTIEKPPVRSLSLKLIRKIFVDFEADQLSQLEVTIAGTYGDAIYHPQFLEICEFLKSHNVRIDLETNGSSQKELFWSRLSGILDDRDRITFSIDGLKDTNHKYRVHAKWNSIESALKTCAQAPVQTNWKMIVFDYNQHQIEQVKVYAQKIGIDTFELVKSARFDRFEQHRPSSDFVAARSEQKNQIRQYMRSRNKALHVIKKLFKSKSLHVVSRCQKGSGIYINFLGEVSPCCNTGVQRPSYWFKKNRKKRNLYDYSFKEIIEAPYWEKLQKKWQSEVSCPFECAVRCGTLCTSTSFGNEKYLTELSSSKGN